MTRSHVSTHVLDTTAGAPASGVTVRLDTGYGDMWDAVAEALTDEDGRVSDLGPERLQPGTYRLTFETGEYFARTGTPTFFPYATVVFDVDDTGRHYHVPLLVSPYALSSYRGS